MFRLVYTDMAASVKSTTNFGIAERAESLRLQFMATEQSRRIGARIRERRKELGLTQKQVAAKMASEAVDNQHISDWERAINEPSERYLLELVDALDVPDFSYFYETPDRDEAPDLMGAFSPDDLAARLAAMDQKLDDLVLMMARLIAAAAVEQDERTGDEGREGGPGSEESSPG